MTRSDPHSGPPCLPPTPAAIARAAQAIRDGGLVGLPTDTVYGLAADATSDAAVESVFRAKGRPADKPLIALIATMAMAEACGTFSAPTLALAEAFWPGPLTLVVPRAAGSPLSPLVHQGAPGVSLRIPGNETACAVVEAAERPLTAPSANPSGAPSPLTAAEVAAGLGAHVALIVDGGRAADSLGSTLLDLTGTAPRLLRAGVVSAEAIKGVIGPIARAD
ncbi:MAG: L-threonylcarbamoyladenylate synthase [Rhodospirillaceae bacterium]|nr:L-threonylcarbamoyladenylate synthase [Rhodospirillaceae bacterium]